MFLDEAIVEFISGRGGSGAVSFHREKHVPRGGPNGADGGRGGSIILVSERGKRTLYDLQLAQKIVAQSADHGMGNKRGRDAKDIEVKVPVGTVIVDHETGDPLIDMATHGMRYVICKGGKGGKGNMHYTSSVRQAPNFAQKGAPGERILAKLELKMLADVALVGLPNAGKSTLISRLSAARPKIADYPFTTIIPNLGVVRFRDESFVIADMPGLIEGASDGIGLGHQFLRHVERCRVLVHVVDTFPVDGSNPRKNFDLIETELRRYSEDIWSRPRIIAMNKLDIVPAGEFNEMRQQFEDLDIPLIAISGATGEGTERLLDAMLEALKAAEPMDTPVILTPDLQAATDQFWDVVPEEGGGFKIVGKRIARMVEMTELTNDEAVRYLHRRLERVGVIDKLRELGAEEGDEVTIGELTFAFTDES